MQKDACPHCARPVAPAVAEVVGQALTETTHRCACGRVIWFWRGFWRPYDRPLQ